MTLEEINEVLNCVELTHPVELADVAAIRVALGDEVEVFHRLREVVVQVHRDGKQSTSGSCRSKARRHTGLYPSTRELPRAYPTPRGRSGYAGKGNEDLMTNEEAKALPLGLYLLTWETGGESLAAVGQLYDGARWYAPVNWTTGHAGERFEASSAWGHVKGALRLGFPRDRGRARSAVQQALYTHASEHVADAIGADALNAIVDAAWSMLPVISDAVRDAFQDAPPAAEPQVARAAGSLWEFVQLAAPALGIELQPHVKVVCDMIDRGSGQPFVPNFRFAVAHGDMPAPRATGFDWRGHRWNPATGQIDTIGRDGKPLAESFPDLTDVVSAERAQADTGALPDGRRPGWCAGPAPGTGPTHAEGARVARNAAEALDLAGFRLKQPDTAVAHQRAALAYAAAKLEETGEGGTTAVARLLLGQISEELA